MIPPGRRFSHDLDPTSGDPGPAFSRAQGGRGRWRTGRSRCWMSVPEILTASIPEILAGRRPAPRLPLRVPGGVGHSAPSTGGAEATPLARKRDEAIVAAGVAVEPQKTVSEDSTVEVCAHLLLDEAGRRVIAFARSCQEGPELFTNDCVQHGLLGPVPLVRGCAARGEEARRRGGSGCDLGSHPRRALRSAYRVGGTLWRAKRS